MVNTDERRHTLYMHPLTDIMYEQTHKYVQKSELPFGVFILNSSTRILLNE